MPDYYVDPSASGANDGSSWEDAWETWADTGAGGDSTIFSNGDTLWVAGGNYGEQFKVKNEDQGLTIRIREDESDEAVFTGGQVYNTDNIHIDGWHNATQFIHLNGVSDGGSCGFLIRVCKNAIFSGMEVERENDNFDSDEAAVHGVAVNGTSDVDNITIERCYIHHHSGDGINIIGTPAIVADKYGSFIIQNNHIYMVADDGIQLGCNYQITVQDNYVDNGGQDPFLGGHPDGVQVNPDGYRIIIQRNTFKGFNQNIFVEWANGDIYLNNNVLIGTRTSGTDRGMTISARNWVAGTNWVQANNVHYNFVTFGTINGGNSIISAVTSAYFGNEIFLNCKTIIFASAVSLLDYTNIYWNDPGVQYYNSSGTPVSIPADQYAGNSRLVDPMFYNAAAEDFRLIVGSPAINCAHDRGRFFSDDLNKNGRIPGTWDAGPICYGVEALMPMSPSSLGIIGI